MLERRCLFVFSCWVLITTGCSKDRCGEATGFFKDSPPPAACFYDDLSVTPAQAVLAASGSSLLPTDLDASAAGTDAGTLTQTGFDAIRELELRVVATSPDREAREGIQVEVLLARADAQKVLTCDRFRLSDDVRAADASIPAQAGQGSTVAALPGRLIPTGVECERRSDEWLTCNLGVDGSAPFTLVHKQLREDSEVVVWACSGGKRSNVSRVRLLGDNPNGDQLRLSVAGGNVDLGVAPSCVLEPDTQRDCGKGAQSRVLSVSIGRTVTSITGSMPVAISINRALSGLISDAFFGLDCAQNTPARVTTLDLGTAKNADGVSTQICVGPRGGSYVLRADALGFSATSDEEALMVADRPSVIHLRRSERPEDGGTAITVCGQPRYCDGRSADQEFRLFAKGEMVDGGCATVDSISEVEAAFLMDAGETARCRVVESQP